MGARESEKVSIKKPDGTKKITLITGILNDKPYKAIASVPFACLRQSHSNPPQNRSSTAPESCTRLQKKSCRTAL
jgi:hypothetical protein